MQGRERALKSAKEIKRVDAAVAWRHLAERKTDKKLDWNFALISSHVDEDERERRLEWFTFVTHDKKAKFEIDLERRLE